MRKLLMEIGSRGRYKITEDGRNVLQQDPADLAGEATLLIRENMDLTIRGGGPVVDSNELWALAEVRVQNAMAAAAHRPAIVVEWLDGGSTFYSLEHGSAHEDETRRLLIIKRKNTEEDGTPTGGQHHRTVIPFEVLRGWEVYPRLVEEPIEQEVMHEALPNGKARCGFRGSRWATTDLPNVTCQTCIDLRVASRR